MFLESDQLKNILLSYNLVLDNEYLDKYCHLIIKNKDFKFKSKATQRHHFIPICYYKYEQNKKMKRAELVKIADSDINNFTVNVLYKDHLLLHYYLHLCSRDDWFAYANFNMLSFLNTDLKHLLDNDLLDNYQLNYEQMMSYQANKYKAKRSDGLKRYYANLSEDQRKERFKNCKGSYKSRKGYRLSEEHKEKIRLKLLGRIFSEASRSKISNYKKENNQIGISKDNQIKYIKKEDLNLYLSQGWKEGFSDCDDKIYIHNATACLCSNKNLLDTYLEDGYELGHNHKTSQKIKGYIAIHKDGIETRISPDQLETYLMAGWTKGRKIESPAQKQVIQFDLAMNEIARFKSIKEANLAMGLSASSTSIGACCKQKQKTCRGYIWRFA